MAKRLVSAHAEMAPLRHLLTAACAGRLENLAEFVAGSRKRLTENCTSLMSERGVEVVATLSRSSSVIDCLLRSDVGRVIVSESRPGLEGLDTARILASEGLDVVVVVDALLPYAAKREGAMGLVGADSVTRRVLVNKAGTLPLAETVPTIAVAGLLKLFDGEVVIKPRPPEEVEDLKRVRVLNLYFDETPLYLLEKLIFEVGPLDPSQIDLAFSKLGEVLLG